MVRKQPVINIPATLQFKARRRLSAAAASRPGGQRTKKSSGAHGPAGRQDDGAGGEPAVAAPPPPMAAADADGGGVVIDPSPSEREREEEAAVLGEDDLPNDDEDYSYSGNEDFSDDDDDTDDDEYVDSDSEFEDDDGHGATAAASNNAVSEAAVGFVGFLGRPTRFAIDHSTAASMRLAAAVPAPDCGGGEIVVHYRYTRFLRAQGGSDDGGVEAHVLGPKQARVRFHHLPSHAAADPASSLHLAGAALAPLLYPARFRAELRTLWTGLVAMAPVPALPLARTCLVVAVDVGILRPGYFTPERMASMRTAMESVAREREALPAVFDVSAELRLPAPLAKEDDVRPAKRRKVAGEDCPICCEALEQGLAAWPRCSHIFHGRCLGEHLVRGSQECPMCRSRLDVDVQLELAST